MKKLPLGKFPRKVLEEEILSKIKIDESIILPPRFGEDGSIVKADTNIIVSAADPITGASKHAGWLSVHINANDIVVHAAKPKWYTTILLFPKNTTEETISNVVNGIMKGLKEIGAYLIGGHSEITEKVTDVIVSGFMMGTPYEKGKIVTSSGAKKGDHIIMTKGAGIEGTFILATEFCTKQKCGKEVIERAQRYKKMISVIPDVEALIKGIGVDNIHAMHDATEGGVLNAVYELAKASNLGFEIHEKRIIVREETKKICEAYKINPIKLISSGTLIATVPKEKSREAIEALRSRGIDANIIGEIKEEGEYRIVEKTGKREISEDELIDELWLLIESE